MTEHIEPPQELTDASLDDISGGPAYKTPGVYVQEVSSRPAARGANPMDLKRGIDTRD